MSDMARIPFELGLRADANWFHDARRTTSINNRVGDEDFTLGSYKFLSLISRADIASG
jgi:hypothetical protein